MDVMMVIVTHRAPGAIMVLLFTLYSACKCSPFIFTVRHCTVGMV